MKIEHFKFDNYFKKMTSHTPRPSSQFYSSSVMTCVSFNPVNHLILIWSFADRSIWSFTQTRLSSTASISGYSLERFSFTSQAHCRGSSGLRSGTVHILRYSTVITRCALKSDDTHLYLHLSVLL